MSKTIKLIVTEENIRNYEAASKRLLSLGIPIDSKALIQILAVNRKEDEIISEFLSLMQNMISKGRKQLRKPKTGGLPQ